MDLLKSIFKGDKVIWMIFLMLCLISVVEVFSASSTLIYKSGDHWGPITRHCIFLLFGAGLVILFHHIPYKWFQVFPMFLLPASAVLLLLVMFGPRVNNAARWMEIGGVAFQPSEFAKMAVIIATASILSKGQNEEGAHPRAFTRIMLIAGGICLLIMPENYSTAVLLGLTVYLMMFIGRVQTRKLLVLAGSLTGLVILFVTFLFATPNDTLKEIPLGHRFVTVKERIADFTRKEQVPPEKFDIDGDAQVGHARIALATSNVLGKGPGNSVQRDFLSQAYSDFIFAIIIEELGLVGGAFVVFLYLCLLIRAGKLAKKCDRTFPAFLALGIGLLLVTQALFNMMVAVGLAPVTGQPLPLISRGGTSTIINCVYIGMLLSISRYVAHLEEQRQHDALIPMTVETLPDEPSQQSNDDSQAQTAEEPTSEMLNSDSEFE